MNKLSKIAVASAVSLAILGCDKVPAGNVGIKVYLLGSDKGVDSEQLSTGRYWIGWNEELYLFPTFTQNYVWTKDDTEMSPGDESIVFQTKEGLSVSSDVGISYSIDPNKVALIFQKYRKGVDEITRVYLRNMVRDAFVAVASTQPIESVYGEGKTELVKLVTERVRNQVKDLGILIEGIYLIGDFRLPNTVITAINAKIEATQKAQQRENEIRQAEAEAKKKIEDAKGTAQSILEIAEAQAKANKILAESLTPELVSYKTIERWDGVLPKMTGQAIPLVKLD